MDPIDRKKFEWEVVVRPVRLEDYDALVAMQLRCFPGMQPWKREQIESPLAILPRGQICVEIDRCTGNLPFVENADIQNAQSGIFTPADVEFARDAIAAECNSNVETRIVHDLNLEQLAEASRSGGHPELEGPPHRFVPGSLPGSGWGGGGKSALRRLTAHPILAKLP